MGECKVKEKSVYFGLGFLIGVGVGLLSYSKLTVSNIGNVDKLTIIHCNEKQEDNSEKKEENPDS